MNLASSTLVAEGKAPNEAMGIVISYSLRVKLNCGTLGGELQTDVPFKLLHPAPGKPHRRSYVQQSPMHVSLTISLPLVALQGLARSRGRSPPP